MEIRAITADLGAITADLGAISTSATTVNSNSHVASSLPDNIRQNLRKAGACVRCGSQDHWVARCPKQPYRSQPTQPVAAVKTLYNPYPEGFPEVTEDEDYDSEDSINTLIKV